MKKNKTKRGICFFLIAVMICLTGCKKEVANPGEEFLAKWFADSEENKELCVLLEEAATVIGEGVEESDNTEAQKKFTDSLKDTYGSYMTETFFETFATNLFYLPYSLYEKDADYKVKDITIEEKGNGYHFDVALTTDKSQENRSISGSFQLEDEKISWLKLTK